MMIDQSWYERPANIREAISAGGIVARIDQGQIYIGLVQEGKNVGYVLPKGHLEPGETIEEAARREISEEAGIHQLELVMELGVRERLDLLKRSWKKIYYFLFTTDQIEGTPTDGHHFYQLHWFPLNQIPPMFWPEQRKLIEEYSEEIQQKLL